MLPAQHTSALSVLTSGLRLGQYQLLEKIGAGGQGVVWSAIDEVRNDTVAMRFSEASVSDRQDADDVMFERQVGRLLKLQHPHILPIYDYGLENRIRYLVSPYVPGGSLFEKIKAGKMPPVEALRFAGEIAAALDYLHGEGIIHRDLKSSNILLDLSRQSYLADFGLARAVSITTQAMHTGRGTPVYSPPEQHKLAEVTGRSDVFSFGILLFELFTGRLPWDGERALGMLQLYSDDELPDPLELNPHLPHALVDVLRRVTAADPAGRPASAGEVMQTLYFIFKIEASAISNEGSHFADATRSRDTAILLEQGLAHWRLDEKTPGLNLSKFALLDQQQKKANAKANAELSRFMLLHALSLGHNHEFWWSAVTEPRERLLISSALLEMHDEALTARVLQHLIADPAIRAVRNGQTDAIVTSLLAMAASTDNPLLRGQLTVGLGILLPARHARWQDTESDPAQNKLLGQLALQDSDFGDEAARLIGRLRVQTAVRTVLEQASPHRQAAALLEIHDSAGSLPALVPAGLRYRIFLEWIIRRLTAKPVHLASAYGLALLGAAAGFALQIYVTYRLPEFLDIARITSSIEQGLIVGTIFGLGIIASRMIVARFSGSRTWPRVLIGCIAGTLAMNTAMLIFHVLFLNTPPSGFLITLACMLIALSYALGGLIRQPLVRMLLSIACIFAAIAGTWWLYRSMSDLTPFFIYENTWSAEQVGLTALAVAALMGSFGNMLDLSTRDQ